MKIHHAVPAMFALSLLSAALPAATEFDDSVPLDLVKIFLGNPGFGEPNLYVDILDGFPPFAVPAGFEVLGSADLVFSQRVVLRTALDEAEARAALQAAFVTAGWQEMDVSGFVMQQQTGFISPVPPNFPRQQFQLCHNQYGNLQVGIGTGSAGRLVNLTRGVQPQGNFNQPTCEEQMQMMQGTFQGRIGRQQGVAQYVPRLELPSQAANAVPRAYGFFGGGGGGSGNDYETRGSLQSDRSINEIHAHFADQIAAQDWVQDTQAVGEVLAIGSWTRTVEGDQELIGVLSVIETGADFYDLRFRVLARSDEGMPNLGIRGQVIQRDPL